MSLVWTEDLPLEAELGRLTRSVKQDGPFAWQFELPSDAALRGTARIEPDWLLFDIPLRRGRSRQWPEYDRLIQLLELNAILPPGVKFVWNCGEQRLHVQAELPHGPDVNPLAKFDTLFEGFQLALDSFLSLRVGPTKAHESADACHEHHGHNCGAPKGNSDRESAPPVVSGQDATQEHGTATGNGVPVPTATAEPSTERCDTWKRLCEETGWVCHARAGGRLAVTLDVPGSFVGATLEPHNGYGLRARLEMDADHPTPVSKKAAAALLLSAGRVVRMARTHVSGSWRNGMNGTHKPAFSERAGEGGNDSSTPSAASSIETNGSAHAGPTKFGWDVVFGELPAAHELDRGLSALSMAARLTLGEMRVLADDRVARHFLAVQGMVL